MKTLKIINNNMTFQNIQKIINYMMYQIKKLQGNLKMNVMVKL